MQISNEICCLVLEPCNFKCDLLQQISLLELSDDMYFWCGICGKLSSTVSGNVNWWDIFRGLVIGHDLPKLKTQPFDLEILLVRIHPSMDTKVQTTICIR